jgi:hypothetical protein
MRKLGHGIGILGVAIAAAACGTSGSGTTAPPAVPLQSAAADHARLTQMLLRLDDLGPNWRQDKPSDTPSKCDPEPKDVTITAGSWKSHGVNLSYGTSTEIHSDAIVFASERDAQKTIALYTAPSVMRCLKHQFQKALRNGSVQLRGVHLSRLNRHSVGDQTAGIRITLNLAKGRQPYQYFLDTFFIRQDRAVGMFSYGAAFKPAPSSTEDALADAIAQRGAFSS